MLGVEMQKEQIAKYLNRLSTKEDKQTASKHVRSCLTWLALREMQIKTANTYHCTPIEIAKIKKADTTKHW